MLALLVGPRCSPENLARWAHTSLRDEPAVFVVGVDRGAEIVVEAGLPLGLAIGDWDSVRSRDFPRALRAMAKAGETKLLTLPRAKERSDLFFALQAVREMKIPRAVVYGFQGGRPDHSLAHLYDTASFAAARMEIASVGDEGTILFATPARSLVAPARKGELVSVFAVGKMAVGVRFRGLRFKARGEIISLSSQGLSNVAESSEIRVSLKRGTLAVWKVHDPELRSRPSDRQQKGKLRD